MGMSGSDMFINALGALQPTNLLFNRHRTGSPFGFPILSMLMAYTACVNGGMHHLSSRCCDENSHTSDL